MIIKTYLTKQHDHYRQAQLLGQRESALDALWRAASHSDMLTPDEHSHTRLTPQRVSYLLSRLGWSR